MQSLTKRIVALTRSGTEVATAIPNLTLYRFDAPTEPVSYLMEPSVCLILQGQKRVILGENEYVYDASRFFVTSIDLPLIAQILEASPTRPYVGLVLKLDRTLVAQLVMENPPAHARSGAAGPAIEVGAISAALVAVVTRLIDLLDEPEAVPVLAPLIQKELLYRLLATECGPKIRQIVTGGSAAHHITRAIASIRSKLQERLRVEDLARHVGMSVSTLHHQFRSLTGMSPLQYQKRLRLNEARRRMLTDRVDAATAAFDVGYESPSQFSREYRRLFGAPPLRDIRRLSVGRSVR